MQRIPLPALSQLTRSLARSRSASPRLYLALGLLLTLTLGPGAALAQSAVAPQSSELDTRLATLATELERQRVAMHVPGMAIAVVKDNEVVMTRGFGSADLANNVPVTAETIFAIGSSSKAFTASVIGMLVDEGKMDWDDPVTNYLPYFKLNVDSEEDDAVVTIRDLLAHRTGFTRMGLLWAGNNATREEILRTATKAKPWSEFRGDFFYNNVTFMAAAVAAETVSGKTWEQLVEHRFFRPLGMSSTTTSVTESKQRPNLSLGYTWKETTERHEQPPMRELDAIAPAGSINSNVVDMAEWVRFQLNRGQVDGKQLLSAEQLNTTWTPQIAINDSIDYGLGWMLHSVQGHRVVEHGGNIDGFSAEVALFPDDNMGFVLLTNLSATPLQSGALTIFADAMLRDTEPQITETNGANGEDLETFTGKYIANFGPFKDSRFTVTAKDGALSVDVPGQTNYQLKAPDEEGKRYFVLTDQIAVSFDRNAADEVVELTMYQGGMTFELPKEGVELVAEIPLDELDKYLGSYHLEENGRSFEVVIQNKRLAVDIPGQMVAELRPPDADGRWVFRATDRVSVTFNRNTDGVVESMTLTEPNDTRTMPRVAESEAEASALPTIAELMKLRSERSALTGRAMKMTGKTHQVHTGVTGTFLAHAHERRQRIDVDFGKFGWTRVIVTGTAGRTESNIAPTDVFEGKYLLQAQLDNAAGWIGDFQHLFDSLQVVRTDTVDGKAVATVRARAGELPARTLYFDLETGDVVKTEVPLLEPNLGVTIPTTTVHSDFRVIGGERIAFRSSTSNPFAGETLVELTEVTFLDALDTALFE